MRIAFLVDGFNLYHSLKAAEKKASHAPLRWLDIGRLCRTIVSSSFGPGAQLAAVHYFSAYAKHLENTKADVVRRHQTFVKALESTGVEVSLGSFKKKDRTNYLSDFKLRVPWFRRSFQVDSRLLRLSFRTHEEKETDVAIACKLLELFARNQCDAAVLVTGDTDIAPAIRTAKVLYPTCTIAVAFPFDRHNRELERIADRSLKLSSQLYAKHQFPAELALRNGKVIRKPAQW